MKSKASKLAASRASSSKKSPLKPPLTVSRPELLRDGSDRQYRRLVHALFAFLARHEAVRAGHGGYIGLFGIEYTVLISIAHLSVEEDDISVNRIAQHLFVSGAFVTNVTNRLARRGLVEKLADTVDRRRVRLQVTQQGFDLLAKLAPVQRQVNDVQWALKDGELEVLIELVERLIDSSDRALRIQDYLRGEAPEAIASSVTLPKAATVDKGQKKVRQPLKRRKAKAA